MKQLTAQEVVYLSKFVPEDDLRTLRFTVGWGPFWFLWWARQGGVTWPSNGHVYLNPRVWATFLYPQRLSTLAHESWHLGQLKRMGSLSYLIGHLAGFLRVREARLRPLEIEAYKIGDEVYLYASNPNGILPLDRSV